MSQNQTECFVSGETIFQEGQAGSKMYVVKEGEVELLFRGKTIATVGKGGILGEMAIIDNRPRSATARATAGCELMPIDHATFLALIRQKPSFAIEVMKVLVERLRLMNERALMGDSDPRT